MAAAPAPSPVSVQRSTAPTKAVPLRRPTPHHSTTAPRTLPLASLTPPSISAPLPLLPTPGTGDAPASSHPVTVQRAPGSAIGALAAAAAATVADTLPRIRPQHRPPAGDPPPPYEPPPPYDPAPPHDPPPPYAQQQQPAQQPPPAYAESPVGGFDPRALTDFQLDELVHRIIGRVTRLIRTELRLDRERIGRLRDPRQ
ncbi:hypothetical protein FHS39_002822 [Streptomyces olivoverticillatus]|uniref:Extensin n=1 Tax=Streptomyces olivoverticillatus TaxID=66427 RepID=A0A7W7LQ97_9ACTN|nr:hypothetical protein [Streptomyces olivoverticillatus]MBB4893791.1 hypothetical protein [Streptomyces olivoverticillatus]